MTVQLGEKRNSSLITDMRQRNWKRPWSGGGVLIRIDKEEK